MENTMERNVITEIGCLEHTIRKSISLGNERGKVLNYTQFQILFYLMEHDGEDICQKDLEAKTHLKKASITASLDSLEDKDLLYREVSETDKRKNYLRLSDKTRNYVNALKQKAKQYNEKIANKISKEDLDVFFRVCDQIYENIKEDADETDL